MPEVSQSRYRVDCGWDDVPHLDAQTKRELLDGTMPYLRDARSKGVPSLGSGAIYPVPESEFIVEPFAVPAYWPRAYGLDVGWKRTAGVWGAHDRNSDTIYLYTEHYQAEQTPSSHATAIKARGEWVPGVIDPASNGRAQKDGAQLLSDYRNLGLKLRPADNNVESGIYQIWERLTTGRLKVFSTMSNWRAEYRLYRRDDKGRVVKENDHLMDATRYLILSGIDVMTVEPVKGIQQTKRSGGSGAGY